MMAAARIGFFLVFRSARTARTVAPAMHPIVHRACSTSERWSNHQALRDGRSSAQGIPRIGESRERQQLGSAEKVNTEAQQGRCQESGIIQKLGQWLLNPPDNAPAATILIRLMAGGVFLWEGILKFVYANQGVGRFTKIGIPFPATMATFVGVLEIVGGILLIAGLLTRLISIPFIIEMLVAILSTKIAIYLGISPLPLPPVPPQTGFWAVLHEVRSEYAQLLCVIFLLLVGPGRWSLDALRAHPRSASRSSIPVGDQ